ncbi:unnamed protein product [Blepharisma stoltei]|uniref:Uncharacterized protein n=1 Tax=Blepharisma stoltei TaxID=1481888 RepID=A0AAU9J434_9CILI|nr:unnamed protein product [Blepharisma stoltei]
MTAFRAIAIFSVSIARFIIALFITIIVPNHSKLAARAAFISSAISKIIIAGGNIALWVTISISKHRAIASWGAICTRSKIIIAILVITRLRAAWV